MFSRQRATSSISSVLRSEPGSRFRYSSSMENKTYELRDFEYEVEDAFESMIGRKLKAVKLVDADDREIDFEFQDGSTQSFWTYQQCCSSSWIEHLELPNDIDGATILSIESSDMFEPFEFHDRNDCIKVYNTVFHTDRGEIVLEYRNSSNGYYGAELVAVRPKS